MRAFSLLSIALLGLTPVLSAQQNQPAAAVPALQSGADKPVPAAASHQIKLAVVVTDHKNQVIPGLNQQDFTVLDNKHPSPVLAFEAVTPTAPAQPPAEVVIVVDEVNVSFQRVAYARSEIEKFLGKNQGKLPAPVSLAFFSDQGTQIQITPSLDGNALIAAFDQHENGLRTINRATGFYGAEDRTTLSLNALQEIAAREATRGGRKLVLWVSPGWPLLTGPRITLTEKQSQGVFNSVVGISTSLRNAGVTLYSVDPLGLADAGGLRTIYYQEFVKGLRKVDDAQIADLALQVIATQTGGLVLYGNNNLSDWLSRCSEDAATFYYVTIEAMPAEKPNEYHDLDIKLTEPGLTARTRTGYYAQP